MGGSGGLPRPSGVARSGAAHGREPLRVCGNQPDEPMTISQLVERERTSLRGLHLLAGAALVVAATSVALALATFLLGSARWLALPRATPIAVWVVVLGLDLAALLLTRAILRRQTTIGT